MTMKNEAVRLFLAITALILTVMLTNPMSEDISTGSTSATAQTANDKKVAITKRQARVKKNVWGLQTNNQKNYRQVRKLSQR